MYDDRLLLYLARLLELKRGTRTSEQLRRVLALLSEDRRDTGGRSFCRRERLLDMMEQRTSVVVSERVEHNDCCDCCSASPNPTEAEALDLQPTFSRREKRDFILSIVQQCSESGAGGDMSFAQLMDRGAKTRELIRTLFISRVLDFEGRSNVVGYDPELQQPIRSRFWVVKVTESGLDDILRGEAFCAI